MQEKILYVHVYAYVTIATACTYVYMGNETYYRYGNWGVCVDTKIDRQLSFDRLEISGYVKFKETSRRQPSNFYRVIDYHFLKTAIFY